MWPCVLKLVRIRFVRVQGFQIYVFHKFIQLNQGKVIFLYPA
jgi:hypothetical protein